MRRSALFLLAAAFAALWVSAPAGAAYGLKDIDVRFVDAAGETQSQAGAHPFAMKTDFAVNTREEPLLGFELPDEESKDVFVTQVQGLAGNPTAVPRCSTLDFLRPAGPCPKKSTVLGVVDVIVSDPEEEVHTLVYNLTPPPGVAAKIGFVVLSVRVTVEVEVEPTPPYRLVARATNISQVVPFYSAKLTLWGTPADPAHDAERGEAVDIPLKPFLTSPRACEGPLATRFEAFSWTGSTFIEEVLTHDDAEPPNPLGFTGCSKLGFSPRASARPSTDQAESPSGLDFELDIADEGLGNPEGISHSDIKRAVVTLPEGVTLNPSIAEGLLTCTKAEFEAESIATEPDKGCPDASKVGTVEADTPILEGRLLQGELFVAQQDDPTTPQPGAENPFDSLIALYMIVREPELGLLIKLAGKVEPNPVTGQIETSFGDPGHELPQYPLGHVRIHLREGGRSPLITPPGCGEFETKAVFTPWANPTNPLETSSTFQITRGVGGGPCPPAGTPPFAPGFSAGTLNNNAKSYSPFNMRLTRRDGDQDLTKFSATLPPGLLGKLAGVSKCSEAEIAAARTKTGRAELASPSCPPGSLIGRTLAGAGVGSQLTYVPGSLYLAGPHLGNPLSVVAIVPAVAGPFDVGTVVVRVALRLNPVTAQVEVDGASSEPIPHILAGIPLRVRDVRVYTDRPQFTLNPTNCDPFATMAQIWGGGAEVFSVLDDSPVTRSERFQAADCASLGFKPKFNFKLKGGTRRGAHPALRTVVTPRPDDANFGRVVVTLPRSAFLDQGHIRTICTRVQYAAKACPPGAVYGFAKAWSPLLDEPAQGPVYLRSSSNDLPDLVMALKGPPSAAVDIDVVGRIDSHKGGIRASFESLPDVPVSKFILDMQGGKKGLIVNSRNLCARRSRAAARLVGQNGRRYDFNPVVRPSCSKQKKQRR